MLGFLPGFAYLAGLDPRLATPRRDDPRTVTPAGTISIGGVQAGVQCLAAPSGWHLLGRTPVRTYHPRRDPVFLIEPGDAVILLCDRSARVGCARSRCRGRRAGRGAGDRMSKLAVVRAGPLTSVQDAGRFGAQRYGLTSSGAMDQLALAAANTLVGNRGDGSGDRDRSLSAQLSRRATALFASPSRALRARSGSAGARCRSARRQSLGEGERLEHRRRAQWRVQHSRHRGRRAGARPCSAASASPRAPASAVPSLARCRRATNWICSRPARPANDVWCSIRRCARCFACLPGPQVR